MIGHYNWKFTRIPDDDYDKIIFLDGYSDPSHKAGLNIRRETGIFLCVNSSELNLGEKYDGKVLNTEQDLRKAVCKDLKECRTKYATIRNEKTEETHNIVANLDEFEIVSRMFRLEVPKDCPPELINQFDEADYDMAPLREGTNYHGVVDGYFVLLKNLDPGNYRIYFGAEGPRNFSRDSEYHVTVLP